MSRPAITAALALSLALAGCGSSGDTTVDKPVASTPASGSATPAKASATSTPTSATAPALPQGYAWQTIDDAGLKFAVPAAWSAINPKELLESGDTSLLDDMAEKIGVTADQMKQAVGTADLMLLAPPKQGYADNVTGVRVALAELPTEAQLKGQFDAVSETEVVVTPGTSPAGPMVGADYVLKVGPTSVHGRTLFFEGADGILNLAISARDAKATAAVSEVIRSTIHQV